MRKRKRERSRVKDSGSFLIYDHVVAASSSSAHRVAKPARLGLFHQLFDYAIALVLATAATQGAKPVVPGVLALCVLVNAAATRGPLSAYRLIAVSVHNTIDAMLVLAILVSAAVLRDDTSRSVTLVGAGLAYSFIIYTTRVFKRAK